MDFRGPKVENQKPNIQEHTPMSMNKFGKNSKNKFYLISQSVLLLAVAIVLIGLMVFLAYDNSTNNNQSKYINSKDLQAVFLNSGQVYFGNIKNINSGYFNLVNIFYLQSKTSGTTSSSSTPAANSVTLVKLGCELHAPLDQMIINTSQVSFWENLSPSGQVSKAVATFWKQNPHGQKCSDQTTATSAQNSTQNTSNNTANSSIKP